MTERTVQGGFARQWAAVESAVLDATRRVGESGWYILGQEVASFEAELARFQGRREAVGCASGLDAIEIGLRAMGLERGARVLTTPLSAFATTLAVVRAGGVPVFVDVDESGLLDLDLAAEVLEEHEDLRFAVPVHLFGHALDRVALAALRDRFELHVLEDCAQAIGAHSHGAPVGGVGRVAAFSFYPTKNLGALGDAGALTTDDDPVAESARALRDYGQSAKYVHDSLGLNSRLDELQAAILRSALLPRLPEWTARRSEIADRYRSGLEHPEVCVVPTPASSTSVWHLFPVRVPGELRDDFTAYLRTAGIPTAVHYPGLIPDQHAMAAVEGVVVHGELATARAFAAEEVSLPIHPFLDEGEIDHVLETVAGWRA